MYVRSVLAGAAEQIGGMARLVAWIKEAPQNEYAFWTSMYMRLMPVQVRGPGPLGELTIEIKPAELTKAMEERGLPTSVFGRDMPILELTAEEPEKGNGKDAEAGSDQGYEGNGRDGEK